MAEKKSRKRVIYIDASKDPRRKQKESALFCNNVSSSRRFPKSQIFLDKLVLEFLVPVEISTRVYDPGAGNSYWTTDSRFVARTRFTEHLSGPSTAHFQIREPPDGETPQTWKVEFNPSKLLHGQNYETGVSPSGLETALERLSEEMRRVGLVALPGQTTVRRLDLAFDFDLGSTDSGAIIRALEARHTSRRTKSTLYRGNGGAQTLHAGPGLKKMRPKGKWMVRLYDRRAIADPEHRQGPLRFEVQLEREGLEKARISRPHDIRTADLPAIMEKYFAYTGLDATIVGGSKLLDRLEEHCATLQPHPSKRANLVGNVYGYAVMRQRGFGESGYSTNLTAKYEKILEDAGCGAIAPESSVEGHLDPATASFVPKN